MMYKRVAYAVVTLIVLLIVGSSLVSIPAGQVGVITQFGRVTGRELNPGLGVKLPWPVQSVEIFDTRVQKEQAEVDAASQDLQQIRSTIALNYHLERGSVSTIFQTVGPDFGSRLIDPAVQESFKATTAKYTAADLIVKRSDVKDNARTQIVERLAKYGIVVDDLSIVNFNFSDEFNKAIEAKQVSQQQAEQAQYNLQQAQLNAQAQEAQKASLTDQILEQQAINKWDGHMPQYVGSGSVFNIPLTK